MTPDQVIARVKRSALKFTCPKCGSQRSKILKSRARRSFEIIWRRRQCLDRACGHRYSTYEMLMPGQ